MMDKSTPLTNAEKQARHRIKRAAEMAELRQQIDQLTAALAERDRENHVLRRVITQQGWRVTMD
jgi:hypothetical protein